MKKEDLKFGNVVELRNGTLCLIHPLRNSGFGYRVGDYGRYEDVILRVLENGSWHNSLSDYEDNLKRKTSKLDLPTLLPVNSDIMKVYEDYTCKKVLWERKEKKLTEDEKVILRNISKEYKYIARDENNSLFVYKTKPFKSVTKWLNANCDKLAFNHLFQFIKWEDEEPYLISDLLKGEN